MIRARGGGRARCFLRLAPWVVSVDQRVKCSIACGRRNYDHQRQLRIRRGAGFHRQESCPSFLARNLPESGCLNRIGPPEFCAAEARAAEVRARDIGRPVERSVAINDWPCNWAPFSFRPRRSAPASSPSRSRRTLPALVVILMDRSLHPAAALGCPSNAGWASRRL
jgi:hypothetical protein